MSFRRILTSIHSVIDKKYHCDHVKVERGHSAEGVIDRGGTDLYCRSKLEKIGELMQLNSELFNN